MTKAAARAILPADKLTFSVTTLAELTDLSANTVRNQIKGGYLVPSYVGTKAIIPRSEAERWIDSLPTERAS